MSHSQPGPALFRPRVTTRSLILLLSCVGLLSGLESRSADPAAPEERVTRVIPGAGEPGSPGIAALAGGAVAIDSLPRERDSVRLDETASQVETVVDTIVQTVVRSGKIERGGSLGRSLQAQGVSPAVVHAVAREMRPIIDFRRSQPGDRYRLIQDLDGNVLDFRYSTQSDVSFHLLREGPDFVVRSEPVEFTRRVVRLAGTVRSTLYEAILDLGESAELASRFVDLFAWDIDFTRSVHAGDDFRLLYEQYYREGDSLSDDTVRPGRILAARYIGKSGDHDAVYFEDEHGVGSYYRADGNAIERQFVTAPLRYDRISSRFSSARRHPILKVTRPHHGIDYAAPEGTPIWSVADGTVIYRGWGGGFGNLVKVRHSQGYVSSYGHLSAFAKGLHVGQRVEQKQLLGYVGHTGLATGPHVCFRVAQNGHYLDPLRLQSPAGRPVPDEVWGDFQIVRDRLLSVLDGDMLHATEEAL